MSCRLKCVCVLSDVPVESLRLRFALLQSLNNTLESFFLPLVELRQTQTYQNSIAALLCEAKGEQVRVKAGRQSWNHELKMWIHKLPAAFQEAEADLLVVEKAVQAFCVF